jgi:hypothetical protein
LPLHRRHCVVANCRLIRLSRFVQLEHSLFNADIIRGRRRLWQSIIAAIDKWRNGLTQCLYWAGQLDVAASGLSARPRTHECQKREVNAQLYWALAGPKWASSSRANSNSRPM